MEILEEIKLLDKEMAEMNLPFGKGLPVLQKRLSEIADRHNTTGSDVFMIYTEWKSGKLNNS